MIVDILRDGIIVERVIIMAIIFLNGYFIPRQLLPSPRMHLFIILFHQDAIFQRGSAT